MMQRIRNVVLVMIGCLSIVLIIPDVYANEDIPIEVKIIYGESDITLHETQDRVYLQTYNSSDFEGERKYRFFPKIFQLQSLYETFIIEDLDTGEIVYRKDGRSAILIDGYNYTYDEPITVTSDDETITLDLELNFKMYFVKEVQFTKASSDFVFVVDVSNPIDIEVINDLFGAWDNYYGNVSDSITIISDNYSANKHKTGTYEVELEAKDGSNNKTRFIYSIQVSDDEPPTIEPLEDIIISYTEVFNVDDLLERVVATDNYTENLGISIKEENYTENTNKVGEYFVEILVDDFNGNTVLVRQKIFVIDDVAPIITGTTAWTLKVSEIFRPADFLNGLSATDEIDEGPIKLYTISSDYVWHEVGVFTVVVGAKDKYGNEATIHVTMTVTDEIAPEFYVKIPQIHVVANQTYNVEELLSLIQEKVTFKYDHIDIVDNQYIGNENTPGVYLLTLNATVGYETIKMQTQVRVNEIPPIASVNDGVKNNNKWLHPTIILTTLPIICLALYGVYRRRKSNKLK